MPWKVGAEPGSGAAFGCGVASTESPPLDLRLLSHSLPRVSALVPPGLALFASVSLTACSVGPNYVRPSAPMSAHFKEAKGWKYATPLDTFDRGPWWSVYKDPVLNSLTRQVEISNQTVIAAMAAYQQARAIIKEAQAGYFPTITTSYSATGAHQGGGSSGSSGFSTTSLTYNPVANATWEIDVWGRIRRTVESDASAAQVSAADLANAKLAEQAALATAYFNLRAEDSLKTLLDRDVVAYKKSLEITRSQFKAGYSATAGDVAAAQALVDTTEGAAIAVGVLRAQYEHAIAVLIGKPPAELTIPPAALARKIPNIPVTIPSVLLERRPDIAAAERTLQSQNALIGVAVANFYPTISLSGMFGYAGGTPLPISAATEAWSLAGSATQPVFEGGLFSAELAAARASYRQYVADYRQTVLTAFQQVEDELAAVRITAKELVPQEAAVKNAGVAVQVYLNQYQAGTIAFTTVITAEETQLSDEVTALQTRQSLFVASVALIEALGGGWDSSLLPGLENLSAVPTIPPPL